MKEEELTRIERACGHSVSNGGDLERFAAVDTLLAVRALRRARELNASYRRGESFAKMLPPEERAGFVVEVGQIDQLTLERDDALARAGASEKARDEAVASAERAEEALHSRTDHIAQLTLARDCARASFDTVGRDLARMAKERDSFAASAKAAIERAEAAEKEASAENTKLVFTKAALASKREELASSQKYNLRLREGIASVLDAKPQSLGAHRSPQNPFEEALVVLGRLLR